MFEKLFGDSDLLSLPVVSMLAFMAIFAGVVVWVFAKKRNRHYEAMARMPLDDEVPGEGSAREEATR